MNKPQNYSNHRQSTPAVHNLLLAIILLLIIFSGKELWVAVNSGQAYSDQLYQFGLVCALAILSIIIRRPYSSILQNRIILLEERFRYYKMTGQELDGRLTMRQIIALRFASDEEYKGLAERAIKESLTPDQIKQLIKNWRPDYLRV